MILREREERDIEGVARVRIDAWRLAYQGIVPQAHLDGLDYAAETARLLQRSLETRGAANFFFYVAVDEADQVLGFGIGGPARESPAEFLGELYALYVHPDCQGQGIGKALAEAVFARLHAAGLEPVIIWALKDNQHACAVYRRLGGTPAAVKQVEIGGRLLEEVGFGYPRAVFAENP